MIKSAKEARGIIKFCGDVCGHMDCKGARGYLEAISKVDPLIQALRQIANRKQYSCECIGEPCSCDFSFMQWTAEQALKLWDAAQNGK